MFTNQNFLLNQTFIEIFANRMQKELLDNAESKGDWRDWQPDISLLDSEMRHHLKKLNQAALDGDRAKVSEYAADIACYAMKYFERFGEPITFGADNSLE